MEWLSKGVEVLVEGLRKRRRAPAAAGAARAFDYDAVVVGSGYGGAVAASRLARAGLAVCVLERGREYVPGEFPNDLSNLPSHVRVDRADAPAPTGKPDALFDIRIGAKMTVLVGSALGGTSQINANVAMRADPAVFRQDAWPDALRRVSDPLDAWYTLAEEMLGVRPVPPADLERTPKYGALRALAPHVARHVRTRAPWSKDFAPEVRCYPARLAITFDEFANGAAARGARPRVANRFGIEQGPCVGCGDCVTGCNYWAKNTLTMNYLPDALRHGAELYTGATVVAVQPGRAPRRGAPEAGTTLWFCPTGEDVARGIERRGLERFERLSARAVVLAGGPLGTVEILMRSANLRLLRVSPRLGKSFSGNGDAVAFGFDQDAPVRAVGWGAFTTGRDGAPLEAPGPTITGVIDARAGVPLRAGHLLEDGIVPGPFARLLHEALATTGTLAQLARCDFKRDGDPRHADPLALDREALAHTQVYLGMGHDDAAGELAWKDDRVIVRWPHEAALDAVERGYALAQCARALGGVPLRNPLHQPLPQEAAEQLSGPRLEGPAITVHPLGGCAMGEDIEHGVVDHAGAVFDGEDPRTTYPGLCVMDGSVMPTALGVNPFLTIAALAERNAALLASRLTGKPQERCVDYALSDSPPVPRPAVPAPPERDTRAPVAFRLRETMRGKLPPPGEDATLRHATSAELEFAVPDFDAFLADPRHALENITGKLRMPWLCKEPFEVTRGRVEILSRVPGSRWTALWKALLWWRALRGRDEIRRFFRSNWDLRALWARARRIPLLLRMLRHAGEARAMPYALDLRHPQTGAAWRLRGAKRIAFEKGRNLWSSLGHLENVRVFDDAGRERARGALELDMIEFTESTTAQLSSPTDLPGALAAFAGYPLLFLRVLLKTHLFDFRAPDYPGAARPRQLFLEALAGVPDEARTQYWLTVREWEHSDEGCGSIPLSLTRFCPRAERAAGAREPILLLHGFAQSSLAFGPDAPEPDGAPTRDTCLAQFLYDSGFDVWLLDYRHSIALDSCTRPYDLDLVALVDLPAAVDFILAALRRERGLSPGDEGVRIAAFGHCMGGATLAMALLSGALAYAPHRSKLSKAVISQVPPFIVGGEYSQWRRELAAFLRDWAKLETVNLAADDAANPFEAAADRLLGTLPVPEGERCPHEGERADPRPDIATCKRVTGVIGPLFRHANLHEGTHRQLHRYFGRGNIEVFAQIGKFFDYERLVSSDGDNVYLTEANVADYLDLPIRFVHGAANRVFSPESAERSSRRLGAINGDRLYGVIQVPGTGHFDCIVGRYARRTVFKPVRRFLRGAADAPQRVALDCLIAKLPELGPIVGWTRIAPDTGRKTVRLWIKVDERDTEPASFLLTAVRDASGRVLEPHVHAWPILVAEGSFGLASDVHPDFARLHGALALADVELPDADEDWQIAALTVHRVAASREGHPPLRREGLPEAAVADLLKFAPDEVQDERESPAYRLPYRGARERLREAAWLRRTRRDPRMLFVPGARPASRADLAEALLEWLRGDLEERARNRAQPARVLSRIRREARAMDEALASVPRAALRPRAGDCALRLLAATCRYAGLDLDRERSDAALEAARAAAREPDRPGASLMLMVGDQIYADRTGGAFDTRSSIEKYAEGYAYAFGSRGFRALARSLPHYMAIEDHEIDNDWSLDRLRRAAEPREAKRQVRRALAGYEAFQSLHGPAPLLGRGFATAFEAGGIPFFILDTRSQRRRGDGRRAPRIAERAQLDALRDWLAAQRADVPKVVVSGSVFFPGLEEFERDGGAYRARADNWQGFPEAQQAVLDAAAACRAQKLVFLSGDYHCAALAQGALVRGGRAIAERVTGVVVPPLYAPLPFANVPPGAVMRAGVVGTTGPVRLDYTAEAFEGWAGFADLSLRDGPGGWGLEAQFRYVDGSRVTRMVRL